jgi:hypothetical protein
MDPAKIRERLGLEDDVSDDEVMEALAYAGFIPAADTDSDTGETTPVAASAPADIVAKSGMIHIDASAWNEREDRIKRLEAQEARRRSEERDQVIAQAVQEGKFSPARRDHWVRLWESDPEGTRQAIGSLAKGLIPIAASGYSTESDEDLDAEYMHLFPPTARKGN